MAIFWPSRQGCISNETPTKMKLLLYTMIMLDSLNPTPKPLLLTFPIPPTRVESLRRLPVLEFVPRTTKPSKKIRRNPNLIWGPVTCFASGLLSGLLYGVDQTLEYRYWNFAKQHPNADPTF